MPTVKELQELCNLQAIDLKMPIAIKVDGNMGSETLKAMDKIRCQQKFLRKKRPGGKKMKYQSEIVEAEKFDVDDLNQHKQLGIYYSMGFGSFIIKDVGKVLDGDWIVTKQDGSQYIYEDAVFQETFKRIK